MSTPSSPAPLAPPAWRPPSSSSVPAVFDVAVVGAGAVGLATAMALAQAGRRVVVVEAEQQVARHQTGNNSGVIHSGLYYKPGSLKATLCTQGRDLMYAFCAEHGVAHERCGKIVVALSEAEVPALDELQRRGTANGLKNLRRLTPDELRQHEPHVAGVAGLYVEETGIVDYKAVTRAYADVTRKLGGEVRLGSTFLGVARDGWDGGPLVVQTSAGELRSKQLVNCGGLHSDRVARLCGLRPEVQIVPFRGEYYQLRADRTNLVRNLIYPVPDPRFPFLGVHFTRMIGGGVEAGPNAVLAFARHGYTRSSFHLRDAWETARCGGFWRMARKYWRTGCGEFHRSFSKRAFVRALQRLLPDLREDDLIPGGAGVRAQALTPQGSLVDDFAVLRADRMVHVLNAPSPAATASISIGRHIAGML